MRRSPGRAALLLACLLALSAALAARAAPLHQSSAPLVVPAGIRAVVVEVDGGDISVRAGTGAGEVRKRWTLEEPELTTTVQGGTLRVTGSCGQPVRLRDVNRGLADLDCGVDVSLRVPAGVTLELHGDAVTTSGVRGRQSLTGKDAVAVDHAGPGPVRARSTGDVVRLSSSRPGSTDLEGDDDVVVSDVATATLKAVSGSAVTLSRLTVRGPLTAQGVAAVSLNRVQAGGAGITSSEDAVAITRSQLDRLTATATDGLALDGVTVPVADLRASPGRVRVLRSRIAELSATGDDSVATTLVDAPARVRLESGSSWVALSLPPERYAVATRTTTGHVTITHVVVDRRSPRTVSLIAHGDISLS